MPTGGDVDCGEGCAPIGGGKYLGNLCTFPSIFLQTLNYSEKKVLIFNNPIQLTHLSTYVLSLGTLTHREILNILPMSPS